MSMPTSQEVTAAIHACLKRKGVFVSAYRVAWHLDMNAAARMTAHEFDQLQVNLQEELEAARAPLMKRRRLALIARA